MRLVDRNWRRELLDGAAGADGLVWLVCPFIKAPIMRLLLDVLPAGELRVVTRFNLKDFAAGASDIEALRLVLQAGGAVRGICGLHAKVYVFGGALAMVTSANLTGRGLNFNSEFGSVSDGPEYVASCVSYATDLWNWAGADLVEAQLDQWTAQIDDVLRKGGLRQQCDGLPDYGTAVPEHFAAPGPFPDGISEPPPNAWPAESGQGFVKFFGQGHDRAARTVSVLAEMKEGRSYYWCTYPRHPWQPNDGDTLFLARMVSGPADSMIFGRAIAVAHDPHRDVVGPDELELWPWSEGWPYYVRVHHVDALDGELGDGVSLMELMDALDSDSFVTTQENAARGAGNTNPRKSLSQAPAVRLSGQGATWLTTRLEAAFARHGRISDDIFADLP